MLKLEGPQKGVAEVMSKIEKDTRTADATIVEIQQITKRKFPNWAMAYSGPSPFLDRHIKPLLSPFTSDGPREELIASLQEKLLRFITAKTADDDPRPPSKLHLVGGIEMIGVPPRQEDDRPLV